MPHIPWVERTFSFDFPTAIYPDIIERYRGTPARIEDKARARPAAMLTRSDGGWSIQENIGHLLDLEPIFTGRFDDFLAGAKALRPADITNRATHEARHNARPIGEILRAFRAAREAAAAKLDGLTESDFARVSLHPRLKTPMRLVDAVAFVCAHDDYHLARVTELMRKFA